MSFKAWLSQFCELFESRTGFAPNINNRTLRDLKVSYMWKRTPEQEIAHVTRSQGRIFELELVKKPVLLTGTLFELIPED